MHHSDAATGRLLEGRILHLQRRCPWHDSLENDGPSNATLPGITPSICPRAYSEATPRQQAIMTLTSSEAVNNQKFSQGGGIPQLTPSQPPLPTKPTSLLSTFSVNQATLRPQMGNAKTTIPTPQTSVIFWAPLPMQRSGNRKP